MDSKKEILHDPLSSLSLSSPLPSPSPPSDDNTQNQKKKDSYSTTSGPHSNNTTIIIDNTDSCTYNPIIISTNYNQTVSTASDGAILGSSIPSGNQSFIPAITVPPEHHGGMFSGVPSSSDNLAYNGGDSGCGGGDGCCYGNDSCSCDCNYCGDCAKDPCGELCHLADGFCDIIVHCCDAIGGCLEACGDCCSACLSCCDGCVIM